MKPRGPKPYRRPTQPGRQQKRPTPRTAPPPPLRVIHEDGHILVVSKPPGMLTSSPTPVGELTLLDLALRHRRRHGSGRAKLWTLHRVDREASGIVLFAATPAANEHLRNQFRSGKVRTLFEGVVEGTITAAADETCTIRAALHEDRSGYVRAVAESEIGLQDARPVTTQYRVIEKSETASRLRFRLSRNHKHQLRAHAQFIGHPILGDRLFGATSNPIDRLALHADEIGFVHPSTGESVLYRDPAPDEFASILRRPDRRRSQARERSETSWDHVADWYAGYQSGQESDHFRDVILPGTLRLLGDLQGQSLIDVACGEGTLIERCAAEGATCVGIDAAPGLIERAKAKNIKDASFAVGDATTLNDIALGDGPTRFDAASCVMALMNIDPLGDVFRGIAARLRPGGRFVAVMLHPAFRAPRQTAWCWGETQDGNCVQYRRVDAYLTPKREPIVMNPGGVAAGEAPVETVTYNRPFQDIVNALAENGMPVDRIEEWPSVRTSEPGPRADAENRARREIPMFLGIRAIRIDRTHTA